MMIVQLNKACRVFSGSQNTKKWTLWIHMPKLATHPTETTTKQEVPTFMMIWDKRMGSLSLGSTWSGQTSLCGSSWGKRARGEHEVFTKETLIITWSLPKVPTSFTPFKSGEILIQCNTLLYKDTNWKSRSNRDPRAQIAYRFTLKFEVSLLQERGWRHADEQRNYETVSSLYKVKVSLGLIEA